MTVFVFSLHSFFQCFCLTVSEAWPFFSALLFATFESITNFPAGAAAVKDLDGAIGGVAETAGEEVEVVEMVSLLHYFFLVLAQKDEQLFFHNFQAFFQLLKFLPFVVRFVVVAAVVLVELYQFLELFFCCLPNNSIFCWFW